MKIRTGFISNSSSCSFVVGVAILHNVDKFKKYIKNKIKDSTFISFTTLKEMKESTRHSDAHYDAQQNRVYIEGINYHQEEIFLKEIFTENSDSDVAEAKTRLLDFDNCVVAAFYESGDDPVYDDSSDSYNYDEVNINWFREDAQKIYKIFQSEDKIPGMLKGTAGMGAGRDG
jgi:hypothetical protein